MPSSGQDGDVGRHTVPPRKTKRRNTTTEKQKTTRTDRKSNYGSPSTKEIKTKHSSRPEGGVGTGSQVERTLSKAAAGRPSKVADCGAGRAKLEVAGEAAAGGPDDRQRNTQ